MSIRRCRVYLLGMMGVCALVSSAVAAGDMEDQPVSPQAWRSFGVLLLSRMETGRGPSVAWPDRQLGLVDRDSTQAVRTAEFLLTNAFDNYDRRTIAVDGRIPLDANPQCLLGVHFTDRFPETRLGNWGRQQFEQCVEQACLVALPTAGSQWRAHLEANLLSEDKTPRRPFDTGEFAWAEAPYLYLYLANRASSITAQHQARKCLARYLLGQCGLEPGLRQYLVLLDQGCRADASWLPVLAQLDEIISHQEDKRLYRQILEDTDSAEDAKEACQRLVRLLVAGSRPREALAALGVLFQRFPDAECAAPDVRQFWEDYHIHREETSRRLIGALTKTGKEMQVLELCRSFDALWTPEEAPRQWEMLVKAAEPGSLVEQLGRVFWARAALATGNADLARTGLRGLTQSLNSLVRAESLALSADLAQSKGSWRESARLYSEAIQMDRPTSLPSWCKGLVQVQALDARASETELETWMPVLRGYHNLMDGDFAAAADSLSQLTPDFRSQPGSLQQALSCALMLAYGGTGDSAEAAARGRQALEEYRKNDPNNDCIVALSGRAQNLDMAICQLATKLRGWSAHSSPDATTIEEQAIHLCEVGARLASSGLQAPTTGEGISHLYAQAKRCQTARVLMAEYRYVRQQWTPSERKAYSPRLEPLLFAAQVLGGDLFDRIQETLASRADPEGANGRMHRFALFAERCNRPDLVKSAIEVVVHEPNSAACVGVLEDIAQRYLAASNCVKALDAYKMIVLHSHDPNRAESAQIKIVNLLAENLKNYNDAIREGEEFVRTYPRSAQICQMEFLLGKLAYLNKDYAGATGQLDGFRKKYPQHSQVGQAMLLAGLGRMAEGDTKEAIRRFSEIIQSHPDGDLAARSKFLIGYAQISEQQYRAAIETFQQLIEQFPDSPYVTQARSLVDRLRKASQ